ncbi:hypothetical protein BS47DRAFT_1366443 [Hydnum rufescens UP504]|uniref:Uncharacterized protein n=1 Tax=Hydnum rufescens UP504 TaxID=1448309 RepID=A0A9P6AL31_9AGAM|nr:hypothetical protein BS47DRAFT_1366443 [Hydnum rufescens UP504]
MHVWYAEEHHALWTAIQDTKTDSTLQFHLSCKFSIFKQLGITWDYSLRQLPYPTDLQSIVHFATSSSVPVEAIPVHSLSTPAPAHELDSDSEDCMEDCGVTVAVSEVVKKIDEDEECSESGLIFDDSTYASEDE